MIKSWWMSVLLLRVIKLTSIQPGPSVLMNLTLEVPWDFVRSRRPMMTTWQWNTSCITGPLYGESTSPGQYLKHGLDIFFVVGNYNLLNKQSRCRFDVHVMSHCEWPVACKRHDGGSLATIAKFGDTGCRSRMFTKLAFELGCDVFLMSHPITWSMAVNHPRSSEVSLLNIHFSQTKLA